MLSTPRMSDPLYKKELLRLAADAVSAGRLPHPDASVTARNPACGDAVTMELAFQGGRIESVAHQTHACILAQASASILGGALVGLDRAAVTSLKESVRAMLTGGAAPAAPFGAYASFDGVAAHTSRHACVLLPFEAVLAAFDDLETAKPRG
jgi:NifU-like protein involved in Fe-S cluster formation